MFSQVAQVFPCAIINLGADMSKINEYGEEQALMAEYYLLAKNKKQNV